jgi:hypothetical protein
LPISKRSSAGTCWFARCWPSEFHEHIHHHDAEIAALCARRHLHLIECRLRPGPSARRQGCGRALSIVVSAPSQLKDFDATPGTVSQFTSATFIYFDF